MNQLNHSQATQTTQAAKWMSEGIKQHELFTRTFRAAKAQALTAGFFFCAARQCLGNGDWGDFIIGYNHKVSRRKVEFYMQFASEALAWVRSVRPELDGTDKLQSAAIELVMQSPKPLVALCRELGFMRKFGEYDSVKYAAKQLLGDRQLELNFSKVWSSLDQLDRLNGDFIFVDLPDGKTESEALAELDQRLERIRAKVRAQIETKTTDI